MEYAGNNINFITTRYEFHWITDQVPNKPLSLIINDKKNENLSNSAGNIDCLLLYLILFCAVPTN